MSERPNTEELLDKLSEFFDADINQYLGEHGGAAEVVDVEGNELIIRLLGEGSVPFAQNFGTLTVKLPEKMPTEYTNCLAIELAE